MTRGAADRLERMPYGPSLSDAEVETLAAKLGIAPGVSPIAIGPYRAPRAVGESAHWEEYTIEVLLAEGGGPVRTVHLRPRGRPRKGAPRLGLWWQRVRRDGVRSKALIWRWDAPASCGKLEFVGSPTAAERALLLRFIEQQAPGRPSIPDLFPSPDSLIDEAFSAAPSLWQESDRVTLRALAREMLVHPRTLAAAFKYHEIDWISFRRRIRERPKTA